MNNEFKTRELSLAVYLISLGLDFTGVEPITSDSFWFVFNEDPQRCYKFEEKFMSTKDLLIKEIKDYQKTQYEKDTKTKK